MDKLKEKTTKVILTSLALVGAASLFCQSEYERGVEFRKKGELDSAFLHLHAAVGAYQVGDSISLGDIYTNLGIVCDLNSDYKSAATYYSIGETSYEQDNNRQGLALNYQCQGASQSKQGNFAEARSYYQWCIDYYTREGDLCEAARTMQNMAVLEKKQAKFAEADSIYSHVERFISTASCDSAILFSIRNNRGSLAQSAGDWEKALMQYQSALQIARDLGLKEKQLRTLRNLRDLHQLMGRPDSALFYSEAHHELWKEVYNTESQETIATLQAEFDASQLSLKLSQSEVARKHTTVWALIAVIGILIIGSIIVIYQAREKTATRVRAQTIIEGYDLEAETISRILIDDVAIPLFAMGESADESQKAEIEAAIKATQFVANLERNSFLEIGMKPALMFLLETLKKEKPLLVKTGIEDVDLDIAPRMHLYRAMEALIIHAVKFEDSSQLDVKLTMNGKEISGELRTNSSRHIDSSLYRSALGRIHQLQGKIRSRHSGGYTETKIRFTA